MYVSAYSSLCHRIEKELPDLQARITELAGRRIRRIDRYIQLCLAGALDCCKHHRLAENTQMIIGTGNGTISMGVEIGQTIYQGKYMPKPLHFVNALGNSACFYLAQTLGLSGSSLVLSERELSFEAALLNGHIALQSDAEFGVLVGAVDEAPLPIDSHAKRMETSFDCTAMLEGSHWLLLSREKTARSLARLLAPEYFDTFVQALEAITASPARKIWCNFQPSLEQTTQLEQQLKTLVTPEAQCQIHRTWSAKAVTDAVAEIVEGPLEEALVLSRDGLDGRYAITRVCGLG